MSLSNFIVFMFAVLGIASVTATAGPPPFVTLEEMRDALSDPDFVIVPAAGAVTTTPNFTTSVASAAEFPLLSFSDVDKFIVKITLFPGATFFPHFHPRATETQFVITGDLMVTIQTEGLVDPRVITNTLSPGMLSVIPEGLIHIVTCVDPSSACEFIAVLDSADPGIVAV